MTLREGQVASVVQAQNKAKTLIMKLINWINICFYRIYLLNYYLYNSFTIKQLHIN